MKMCLCVCLLVCVYQKMLHMHMEHARLYACKVGFGKQLGQSCHGNQTSLKLRAKLLLATSGSWRPFLAAPSAPEGTGEKQMEVLVTCSLCIVLSLEVFSA